MVMNKMNQKEYVKNLTYDDFVSFMHRYEREKGKTHRKLRETKKTGCYQYKSVFKKGK